MEKAKLDINRETLKPNDPLTAVKVSLAKIEGLSAADITTLKPMLLVARDWTFPLTDSDGIPADWSSAQTGLKKLIEPWVGDGSEAYTLFGKSMPLPKEDQALLIAAGAVEYVVLDAIDRIDKVQEPMKYRMYHSILQFQNAALLQAAAQKGIKFAQIEQRYRSAQSAMAPFVAAMSKLSGMNDADIKMAQATLHDEEELNELRKLWGNGDPEYIQTHKELAALGLQSFLLSLFGLKDQPEKDECVKYLAAAKLKAVPPLRDSIIEAQKIIQGFLEYKEEDRAELPEVDEDEE